MRAAALGTWLLMGLGADAAAQAPVDTTPRASALPSPPPPDTRLEIEAYDALADERMGWVSLAWSARARGNYPQNGLFIVERSTDGLHWARFGEQPFWVSPRLAETYRFTDRLDLGYRYYRLLAQYDRGPLMLLRTTRLDLVRALMHVEHRLDAPARRLELNYILDQPKRLLLRLYDRIGQQILTLGLPSQQTGSHRYALDLAPLAPGTYLVELTQVEDDLKVGEVRFEWRPTPAKSPRSGQGPRPRPR